METKDMIKHDTDSVYWQSGKQYAKSMSDKPDNVKPAPTPGCVRDMSPRIKEQRILSIKEALRKVERMKKMKCAKDKIDVIMADNAADKIAKKIEQLKSGNSYRGYKSATTRQVSFLQAKANLPQINGLMSAKTYGTVKRLTRSSCSRHIKDGIVDSIQLGVRYFIFNDWIADKEKERIKSMLSGYISESEMKAKHNIPKYRLYTADALVEMQAILIDGCLFFKPNK